MQPYSIFIPSAPKDRNKLKFLVASIDKYLEEVNEIFICVPDKTQFEGYIPVSNKCQIHLVEDQSVLNLDHSRFRYRGHWVYQQFLKLFQNVTSNDLFLTIDADVIINRHIPMFDPDGRKILWMGWEQYNRPYFEFQERMLNLPRLYPHTFINDMNFFSKSIINEIMQRNGYTKESFIEKSIEIIDENCYIAEPEIWGNYIYKYYPHLYSFREAKTFSLSRWADDFHHEVWTDDDIQNEINKAASLDFDMYTLHTWYLKK